MGKMRSVNIIGGGIGGLATAALLAREGYKVTIFEKNQTLGGVCNRFEANGFTYDTGPSWYMMPDIFEEFFVSLGERIEDHLELVRLNPACRMFFNAPNRFDLDPEQGRGVDSQSVDLFSDFERDKETFESLEPGSAERIKHYLARSQEKYDFVKNYVFNESKNTFLDYAVLIFKRGGLRLGLVSTMEQEIERVTKNDELQAILQYPTLFLGAAPKRIPALYSFMSHAALEQGIWYPKGGMYKIIEALVSIGKKHGVEYRTSSPVKSILIENGTAVGVELENGESYSSDIVISNADRYHTEELLLPPEYQDHAQKYWGKSVPTYSALLLFLGVNKKLSELAHHNFFFAKNWKKHLEDIDLGILSPEPSFYLGMPRQTDSACAPEGMENIFVLIPVPTAPDISKEVFDQYADKVIEKINKIMPDFREGIIYEKRWYPKDFGEQYNLFENSALGLAQTFFQTGPFRPSHKSNRLKNLYFVGSTTNPGIGLPTCLVSAKQVFQAIK